MDNINTQKKIYNERVGTIKQFNFSRYEEEAFGYIETIARDANVKKVLDIGCGAGKYSRRLAEKFPNLEITGLDISEKSIEMAKTNCPANVKFFITDGASLNLEEKFDFVMLNHSFEHVENKEKLFSEITKVIKEDTPIFIAVPNLLSAPSLLAFIKDKITPGSKILKSVGHEHMMTYWQYKKEIMKNNFYIVKEKGTDVISYEQVDSSFRPFASLLAPYIFFRRFVPFLGIHKLLRLIDEKILNRILIGLSANLIFIIKKK